MLQIAAVAMAIGRVAPAPPGPPSVPNIATAHWLDSYPMAKCLDGTPAIYYLRKATAAVNKTKWVIHIQGGGWCSTPAECASRAQSRLGSSARKYNNNDTMDLNDIEGCDNNRWCGELMVNDPILNPLAHDWNAAFLYYCDGASWTGNQAEPVDGLYYRGWHNMQAAMADLVAKEDLGDATVALIGGDSAGGLATYLHIDYMREQIQGGNPTARVLGQPDSGFWPDGLGFDTRFAGFFAMQNSTAGLDAKCVAAETNVSRCLFPQYFAQYIETPLLPMQSIYDPLQRSADRDGHGQWIIDNMNRTILSKPQNGAWIHSCERHCGAELLTIDGVQYPEAVTEFFFGAHPPPQRLWLQHQPYPCAACCNDNCTDCGAGAMRLALYGAGL
mmetsp:Transcript_6146/g.15723  ORF Transcript_6146/g.15723 Transcript_6146/m.15723 type:complete len:387 (+) Transcript_6146:63-1223(+)